ncbi:MAG: PAS domain S-box protein [Candidatus Hydrogenedentales bacterium]
MPSKFDKVKSNEVTWIPLRTVVVYTLAGALWIAFSDVTLGALGQAPEWHTFISVAKGWGFIAVTALLLYLGLFRQLRRLERETSEHVRDLNRLNAVQNALQDGLLVCTAVRTEGRITDFRYEYLNPGAERLLGKSSLVGRTMLEVFPNVKGHAAFDQFVRVVEDGTPSNAEFSYDADGLRSWFRHTCVKLGDGFVLLFQDISFRKAAEEALRASERKYRELVQNASSIILRIDREGRITFFNEFAQSFFGYSADEILGQYAVGTIVPLTDRGGRDLPKMVDDLLVRPEHYANNENENVRKNGERVWIAWTNTAVRDVHGDIQEILCVGNDVSERKRAEDELRKLSRAVEQSPASIVITNAKGDIEYVNPKFCEVTGYAREEALGHNSRMLKSGELSAEGYGKLWEVISNGGEWRGEFHNRKKNGELYWESASISPIFTSQGAISHYVAIKEVITQRKRNEQELQRMNRALKALSECNEALVRLSDESQLLDEVCRVIHEVGGYAFAWVGYAENDAEKTLRPVAWAGREEGYLSCCRFSWSETSQFGRGPAGVAVRTGKPQVIQDMASEPQFAPWLEEATKRGYAAGVFFPLPGESGVLGTLAIISEEKGVLHREEEKLLEELAADLAFGIRTLRSRARHAKTERALTQSQDRYHKLFDEATEGIVLADAETGGILDCNQAFLHMSGYEREELLGCLQGILHPEEERGEHVSRTFDQHRTDSGGTVLPSVLLTKSGALKQVEIKANTLEFEGRTVMLGFFRDVTDDLRHRRERESTLRMLQLINENTETHDLIRAVTAYLQEWMNCEAVGIRLQEGDDFPYFETRGFSREFVRTEKWLCSKDANGEPLRDTLGNPVLDCMCGNVLQGRFDPSKPFFTARGSFWSNGTTELLASTTDADRQARTRNRCNGEGYESVALIALRHGTQTLGLLQFNDREKNRFTPELLAFIENAADQVAIALAQRQSQKALRVSEQRFRDVSQAAGEFIWEMDLEAKFTYLSERVERVMGFRPDEMIGARLFDLVEKPGKEEIAAFFAEHVETRESVRDLELCMLSKAGAPVWLQIRSLPVLGSSGDLFGFRGAAMDITEQKLAEHEKQKLEMQLFQAQKMESIGRLAGGVAHDFNNMLSVILGYTQFAQKQVEPSSSLHGDLQEVLDAAKRSTDLTRQLLAFARQQTVNPAVLDLNDTISGMIKMLRRLIGEDIDLVWSPGPDTWKVRLDPAQVDQILANLVVNARDAISGTGSIAIHTANATLDRVHFAEDPAFVPGQYVMLAVKDTGSGIGVDVQEHIFEPFFTTKEKGKGTGLGLSTVYGIVKQNGGIVHVESEPGQGATFRIYLPCHNAEAASSAHAELAGELQGGTETILLVEDEEGLLSLVIRALESLGYTVLAAKSPQHAIHIAKSHDKPIDLLLTDVIMPEMNGRVLSERLVAIRPGLKLLFMSGYPADVIARQGVLAEGINFLLKPFRIETLASEVRKALEKE